MTGSEFLLREDGTVDVEAVAREIDRQLAVTSGDRNRQRVLIGDMVEEQAKRAALAISNPDLCRLKQIRDHIYGLECGPSINAVRSQIRQLEDERDAIFDARPDLYDHPELF